MSREWWRDTFLIGGGVGAAFAFDNFTEHDAVNGVIFVIFGLAQLAGAAWIEVDS